MEKKTIGEFIAALRKVNGLTQKQLAEMLGVSDKTVSRWERNETAPDLTLIPVIAEIFNITSDELLRGERRQPDESAIPNAGSSRGEKQVQRILSLTKTKYTVRSMASVGIAVIGILLAIGCAAAVRRYSVGVTVGCVVIAAAYLAAVLCQIISAITAFTSINSEAFGGDVMDRLKQKIIKTAAYIVSGSGILGVVGVITVCGFDEFEWGVLTLFWCAVALVGYAILWQIIKRRLMKHGCNFLEPKTEEKTPD